MAYIGREPQIGNFQVCDAISVVNAQAAYTMQVSSVDVIPESVNHMIVSLNGVIQKPGSSYTISSATITFSRNLVTGETIDFIYLLGNVLDLGTPSDDTVTGAKIVDNAINSEHYTDASIDLAHMSADSVDGSKIADNAINSEHYTDGSIDTAHIAADQITNAKIADDQIDSEHYVDGSIDLAHLAADSVNGTKIADDAVNSEHYTDGSIDTAHIADGQVTIAKLATAVLTGATDIGADLADADLILVDDGAGGTLRKAALSRIKTYAGGGNTPGFQAHASSAQTGVSDSTWTKVSLDTEIYDSDGKFASSRFTPTVAGYYHCFGAVYIDGASDNIEDHVVSIYKNGSRFLDHTWDDGGDQIVRQSLYVAGTIYLDGNDYIELYAFCDVASGNVTFDASSRLETHMGAFKVA